MKTLLRLQTSGLASMRLDQALALLVPDRSRSFLARAIDEGNVRVSGKIVTRKSHTVTSDDEIELEIPDPQESRIEKQDLPLEILYQDDDVAVINKAAGVVVHPAAGHNDSTLVHALLFHLPDLSGIGGEIRPGIVHRLDKDTSGVLVVAKNDEAHRRLTERWNTEATQKEYLAVVYGRPKALEGRIEAPIGRDSRDRKKMAVVGDGKPAVTLWKQLEDFRYATLLRCALKSGRTHQIRVHLKSIGHPIVGDPLYSGPQWRGIPDKRLQRIVASVDRQALHAAKLSFEHPRSGERMTFEAPVPEDMQRLIDALRG